MTARKSMWFLLGIFMINPWVLGSAVQAGTETMNFRFYSYVVKAEEASIGDVEDHSLGLETRRAFYVFENGEVATSINFISGDYIKGAGSNISYLTLTFAEGSTIIIRRQSTVTEAGESASSAIKGEVIKGTGRFVGIKGTQTAKGKFLPLEKGELGRKTIGEGTISYTLPSK